MLISCLYIYIYVGCIYAMDVLPPVSLSGLEYSHKSPSYAQCNGMAYVNYIYSISQPKYSYKAKLPTCQQFIWKTYHLDTVNLLSILVK